jgi:hypothetical protein
VFGMGWEKDVNIKRNSVEISIFLWASLRTNCASFNLTSHIDAKEKAEYKISAPQFDLNYSTET